MLPPILNSPGCHQKWEAAQRGGPPLRTFMHRCHSILNCGKDSLLSEVFAGIQGAGPPGGGCKGEALPCLENFVLGVNTIRNFVTFFVKNC